MTTEIVPHATYYFYRILNTITGKSYIGVTVDYKSRKSKHFSELQRNVHHSQKLQRSYNKYGHEAFEFVVIEQDTHTEYSAIEREVELIAAYDSYNNGYNMSVGGNIGDLSAISVEWEKVRYESVAEAAIACGITPSAMSNRIRRGYKAIADVPGQGGTIACEWEGKIYPSIRDASIATGIPYTALAQRIKNGYKSEAEMVFSTWRNKSVVWEGVEYESVKAFADAKGLSPRSAYEYIQFGYTSFSDISSAGGHGAKEIIWDDVTYASIRQCADAIGVSHTTLRRWLAKGYSCSTDVPPHKNQPK